MKQPKKIHLKGSPKHIEPNTEFTDNPFEYFLDPIPATEKPVGEEDIHNPGFEVLDAWNTDTTTNNASELRRLNVPFFGAHDNSTSLAAFQTDGEQWGRAAMGFGKGMVAGFVDSVAAWDVEGLYDTAMGNHEKDFGNWLNESGVAKWAKDMEGLEIYSEDDSMFSAAYWAKQMQSQGYTAGIMLEAMGEQALLAALTGGSGNVAGLATKGRFLGQAAFGTVKGIQEGYMNALETGKGVEEKYKQMGYSDEVAKQKGAEAATLGFRTEVGPLMVLNGLQYASMFGRPARAFASKQGVETGFSSLGEGLFGNLAGRLSNKYAREGVEFLGQAVSEGMEEVIQTSIGKYAEYKTLQSTGDEDLRGVDYFDRETLDSFVAGAIGGGMFTGMGIAYNKMSEQLFGKPAYKTAQINFINGALTRSANAFKDAEKVSADLKRAAIKYAKNKTKENFNTFQDLVAKARAAQHNTHLTNAINALQLDYINGNTNAFDSHIDQMEKILEATENGDIETLKKYGLVDGKNQEKYKNSFNVIKDTFRQNIEDSNKIKSLLENNLLNVTSDFESAFDVTRKEYMNHKHLQEVNQIGVDLNQAYTLDNYVQQLSPEGKRKFQLENEYNALEQISNTEDTKALSTEDKARMKEIEEELSGLSYTTADRRLLPNIDKQGYINAHVSMVSIGQAIDENNVEIGKLKDKNTIKSNIKSRLNNKIKQATSKQEVEEVEEEAAEQEIEVTPEAGAKKTELDNQEKIVNVPSDGAKITKPETKPEPSSKEEDPEILDIAELLNSGQLSSDMSGEGQAFSRRSINPNQITEEHRAKAKAIIEKKDREQGKQITLEDLIRDSIERHGYERTQSFYGGLVKTFELANRDVSTADQIYDKYFSDETDLFMALTEEGASVQTDTVNTEAKVITSKPVGLHEPVVTPEQVQEDKRTNKTNPKIAYNFQRYTRNGNVYTITSTSLEGDTHFILDPDFVQEGDTLRIEVLNDDNIPVSHEGNRTTWGQLKGTLDEQTYTNKVPMGIYKVDAEGVFHFLGYVHDAAWYKPANMSGVNGVEAQEALAKAGYEKVVAIRQAVLNNNGVADVEVTSREFGSVDKISQSSNTEPISIDQATGDSILTAVKTDGKGNTILESKAGVPVNVKILNDLNAVRNSVKVFRPGSLVELRHAYSTPNGTKVYIALPTMNKTSNSVSQNLRQDLNPEILNSVKYAVLANAILKYADNQTALNFFETQFNLTLSDARRIQEDIKNTLRLDLSTTQGVTEYAGYFLRMSRGKVVLDNRTTIDLPRLLDSFERNTFDLIFSDRGTINKASFNVDYKKLNATTLENVSIPTISEKGEVQNNYSNYNDLVRKNIYTNVRSHEITRADGSKMWVTDVQPMVQYNLKSEQPTIVSEQPTIQETQETDEVVDELDGLSDEDRALIESLRKTRDNDNEFYNSRRVLIDEQISEIEGTVTEGKVSALTDLEFRELISSLKNIYLNSLDYNAKISTKTLKDSLETLVESQINPILSKYKEKRDKFASIPSLSDLIGELDSRIAKLENVIAEKEKITGNNGVLLKEVNKLFGINLAEEVSGEEEFDSSNNFKKSFLEKDIKLSYSNRLKMSFFGIPELKVGSSQEVLNDLTELPVYQDADYVENILKSVTTTIPSDWNVLMNRLSQRYQETNNPIYNQLRNQLKDLPKNLQNELLYKTIATKFTAHKVINSVSKDGNSYTLTVIDENSSKENIKLKRQIRDNFVYDSPLTMVEINTNDRILNKTVAAKYIKAFNLHKQKGTFANGYTPESGKALKKLFKAIGIELSDNTIREYLNYNDPFNKQQGLLHYVNTKLNQLNALNGVNKVVVTEENHNLFDSANKALNNLIDLEIALNGTGIAKSIRIGGKTLQGVIQNTAANDILKDLKSGDQTLVDKMLSIGYTENNLLLQQLKLNPQMREILELSFSSPESYKINGKKTFSDTGYDKLSDTDGLIAQLGLYTNRRGHVSLNNSNDIRLGLNFRVGQLPFMTLSDKGRMLYMKTILIDGTDTQFKENHTTGEIIIDSAITDLLFEQAFLSEYNRIATAYSNEDPHINSFSDASKIFTFLPIFNTIEMGGMNIHDIIKEKIKKGDPIPKAEYFKEAAVNMLREYINSEVNQKLDFEGNGLIADANLYKNGKLNNIDTEALDRFKGTQLTKGRKLFAEHAVNNLLHQISIYQLFLGDMAYYAKTKGLIDAEGYVNSEFISNNYLNMAQTIGQVVDKRSASLIAPGFTLANSSSVEMNNDKYIQIQMLDVESISTIIEPLIRASKDSLSPTEENAFKTINESEDEAKIRDAYNTLRDLNPELSDYFSMEGTDAQEYTTWKAHVDLLYRQGNLTEEQKELLDSAYAKMSEGKFDEVSKEEINVVMQPVKPVYTGMIPLNNSQGEVISMRPVYIKSSSFPLLPQVTKNLKLDNLRKNLEAIEARTNKTVRASYQTANKIGANQTMLTVDDLYTMTPEQLLSTTRKGRNLLDSALVELDTKNFKIQQETPDKVTKYLSKNKDNEISMGSQFWKILLGNGVNKMTDNVFPNLFSSDLLSAIGIENKEMLNGQDLEKVNNWVYNKFSKAKLDLLYSRIGLDRGVPFNQMGAGEKRDMLQNVINILKEEVTTRNYPEYLTEALNLIEYENGQVALQQPLFLDSNANKFESLLLSLVTNTTVFHKLPGLGHISSSGEGFEKITNLQELSREDKEGIVWMNGYSGRLKATRLEDGTITESEVLIKSHYRYTKIENGEKVTKLVDFTSDTYSEPIYENGVIVGRKLKLDMIDEELLSNFSFRIPTSSHQSGVMLKIVGFLPPESGDMLVVPAEHTVQLGEDYDIDKRYIYKSNYELESNGKISKVQYRQELNDDALSRLFSAILPGEEVETNKDLKVRIKMYENAMIDMYKSVFQSPSKEVQQKIFKPLSVGVAKNTAKVMDDKLNSDLSPYFSSLSDTYQRKLLKAGSDGKGGIGVHSNAVTLEAQMQRLNEADKLQLRHLETDFDSDGNLYMYYAPTVEYIGRLVSNPILGQSFKSIDGARDIADQHGENQNVSTDNINEQIMAKRNENTYTMSVYALMATRGFDLSLDNVVQNNNKPMHIPSLFINQPIIRDYVALKAQQDSISGDYVADKEEVVLNTLLAKYGYTPDTFKYTGTNFMSEQDYTKGTIYMSGQSFYDSLEESVALSRETTRLMQLATLQKFYKFKEEAAELSKIQRLISLSTSGLGISYFETLERLDGLNDLPNSSIANASKLVGEYIDPVLVETGEVEIDLSEYRKVGYFYWKPTTIEGIMLLDSLEASQKLMDVFFPYKDGFIDSSLFSIGAIVGDIRLEQKYEIMREMRSFFNTFENMGYFEGDINEERRRLFMDTTQNTSLASIIKDIQIKKLPIASNPFIRNLQPQVRAITEPSIIQHVNNDNTSLDSYTEYDGFRRLLLDNKTNLGEFNGEIMTPRKLAQDLISYAMLADAQNGATGFESLIPVNYLQLVKADEALRLNFESSANETMVRKFTEQYLQHNPERAYILSSSTILPSSIQVEDENIAKMLDVANSNIIEGKPNNFNNILANLQSFRILQDVVDGVPYPSYVSVRNSNIKNSENRFNLYKLDRATLTYNKIPTLGTRGLKEYNANVASQASIIPSLQPITPVSRGGQFTDVETKQSYGVPTITTLFPETIGIEGILNAYKNSAFTDEKTKDFIEKLLEYGDLSSKIVYTAPANNALGQYNSNTDEIYIHPQIFDKLLSQYKSMDAVRPIVREILLEEIIHSMTVKEFKKYVKSEVDGEITLVDDAPLFATKLVALYTTAKEALPYSASDASTYYSKDIYEFMAGMFVAPDYRARLEEAHPNIVKRFLEALKSMLGRLFTNKTGEVLSYNDETFNAVYDLLKNRDVKERANEIFGRTSENPMDRIIKEDSTPPTQESVSSVQYYEGDIQPDENTIFVFGSNPEGRHGKGAAEVAKNQFGAKYGQGEGLQGNAYALPTKDLRVKDNNGFKSISRGDIIHNIIKLYEVAEQNPTKQFKVAYRNTTKASLNGYTGLEMIQMFKDATALKDMPSNIIFSKEWVDTGLFDTNESRQRLPEIKNCK